MIGRKDIHNDDGTLRQSLFFGLSDPAGGEGSALGRFDRHGRYDHYHLGMVTGHSPQLSSADRIIMDSMRPNRPSQCG